MKNCFAKLCAAVCLAALLLSAAGCAKTGESSGAQTGNGGYREDAATADLQAAVQEALGDAYWPNMDIDAQMLEDLFGVPAELYEEFSGQMPMISANVDTLLIFKAAEGKEADLEAALNAYRDHNVNDAMQYPSNMGKVQASQIETFGRYVCFVQLGGDVTEVEESAEDSDAAVIEHCEKENAKALEAIEELLISGEG